MDKIEILLGKIEDTKRQIDLKVKFATRALDNDELEKAEKLEQEIADLRSELKDKEEELAKLKEEENADPETVTVQNDGRSTRSQFNAFDLGVMPETKVTSQEVRDFKAYLESRDDIKGGSLKTDSGFVVIPEEIVTDILKLKEVEFNLDKYVTVKKVTNGSGKYPVVRQSEVAALPEVEELAENPDLAVKPFFELAYDIKTRRGYFRISREAIEDSQINVLQELKLWLARTIAATRNKAIIDVIQNGGPGEKGGTTKLQSVEANGIDGLKDAVNLNIKPNYEHNVAIVSQTMFAKLDKLKDKNGNYLIQPDVKEASQKRLLGAKVEILPDEMLGDKGNEKLIFGNLKDALVLFDRSQYQASWTDYMHFGECLMVAVRQDVRIFDYKAAIVIDYKDVKPQAEELQSI
ncbi:TPA: phage major capsid protein [Staphylococcus pseudintermedius]|uniref:phage major capsid protein n=1 Tax=Staphylococcus pseudintermedius TaxID=283734 RepID=UPI00109D7BED|nr:phage major capsid protein [Staphylococcus pseudintermedius]EGQ2779988.1 phage major capsid protein [Staphylococcus pseudintermedius]EKH7767880.1 phage major capsid protein [Staphylococcus pseudintermedius]QIW07637.1 phage major capsid protein [Staphylococcus pseudintermedius]HAR6607505.1 phage major capsid protein [Staphylococcus pseudintermedius]HCT0421661.1 phage major capsid protein [Staphylococcus pseudintermedius]